MLSFLYNKNTLSNSVYFWAILFITKGYMFLDIENERGYLLHHIIFSAHLSTSAEI